MNHEHYSDPTAEQAIRNVMREQRMYKSCSKCGKIHDVKFKCKITRTYKEIDNERHLRSTFAWTKKSLEIREKANNLCEVCRDKGTYTYDNLEVHHIAKVTEDKSLLLDDYNLICLCQYHHKQADSGEINADYLRELASKRENR